MDGCERRTFSKLKIAGNIGEAMADAAKACSFTPDTLVLLSDGTTRPIKDIELGDEVLATDPKTGTTEAKPVIRL
jgi:hypothetical protein